MGLIIEWYKNRAVSKSPHLQYRAMTYFSVFQPGFLPQNRLRFCQWHWRVLPYRIKELNDIYGHYRCILWALSMSKMHLRSGLHPKPSWGSLTRSPRPTSLLSLSKNLFRAVGLQLQISCCPQDKFLATRMDSASNQNCYKGFHFKEQV